MDIRELIEDRAINQQTEVMLLEGLDEALLGTTGEGETLRACYSEQKCFEILMRDEEMDRDEALDYFYFNVQPISGASGGPLFIDTLMF
jgi:hypothetical protein